MTAPRALLATSALALAATALAACGGDDATAGGALAAVEVEGDVNSQPTVTITDEPLQLDANEVAVLVEGDGETTAADDRVELQYALVNGADGELIDSSYDTTGPQTVRLDDPQGLPFLLESLRERQVGDRLLIGLAPGEAFEGELATDAPFAAEDSLLYVVDLLRVVADTATGEPVTDVPAGLPQVQADDQDRVTGITVPGGEPPTELVVQPLVRGTGPEVTADDTLTVQYWGVLWSDGSTFDSSWETGAPAEFPLSGVIAGWTQGLAGQTVGSRVLLVVPPDLGYGDAEQGGIPPGSTLVFAVDILAAA